MEKFQKTLIQNIPDAICSHKYLFQDYFPMPLGVKIIIRFHNSLSNNLKILIDKKLQSINKS